MAIPVPIALCDACDRRTVLTAAAFVFLRSHGPGHFCPTCRELCGEEADPVR